jgi:pyruvate-ferredoxin/flavodoxin oxidoreductase
LTWTGLEYKGPQIPLKDYVYNETRYRMLVQSNPAAAEKLLGEAQVEVNDRWENLKNKAGL